MKRLVETATHCCVISLRKSNHEPNLPKMPRLNKLRVYKDPNIITTLATLPTATISYNETKSERKSDVMTSPDQGLNRSARA